MGNLLLLLFGKAADFSTKVCKPYRTMVVELIPVSDGKCQLLHGVQQSLSTKVVRTYEGKILQSERRVQTRKGANLTASKDKRDCSRAVCANKTDCVAINATKPTAASCI